MADDPKRLELTVTAGEIQFIGAGPADQVMLAFDRWSRLVASRPLEEEEAAPDHETDPAAPVKRIRRRPAPPT